MHGNLSEWSVFQNYATLNITNFDVSWKEKNLKPRIINANEFELPKVCSYAIFTMFIKHYLAYIMLLKIKNIWLFLTQLLLPFLICPITFWCFEIIVVELCSCLLYWASGESVYNLCQCFCGLPGMPSL